MIGSLTVLLDPTSALLNPTAVRGMVCRRVCHRLSEDGHEGMPEGQIFRHEMNLIWQTLTLMGSMSRSGGTTTGCAALVCFGGAAGAFFVVPGSSSGGPSLSFVAVLVTFRVTVFFTGAGGSLGFIAAVLVVRVVVIGAGSVGVAAFERVALVVIVAVEVTGFGRREAILCTRFGSSADVSLSIDATRLRSRSLFVPRHRLWSSIGPFLISPSWFFEHGLFAKILAGQA